MSKELDSSDTTQADPHDQRIAELEARLHARDAVIAELQEQVRQLQEHLDGAKRAGKRQATPFAREKRVAEPKRPGRKKGKGRFASRPRPTPEDVTETKLESLTRCPECSGEVTQRKEHEQFVVDIPSVKPVITR